MQLVIGLGETGKPLFEVLPMAMPTVGYDVKQDVKLTLRADTMNICIPFSPQFIDIVREYQVRFRPNLTVIHSTVPIGVTSQIPEAVQSPILGRHHNMRADIKNFVKSIGGHRADYAAEVFEQAGIKCKVLARPGWTEALKLLCLAKYGKDIAFAQYCSDVCRSVGLDDLALIEWDANYNAHVEENLRRPLLYPPGRTIGGHCVVQGTRLLNEQRPNSMLQEITVSTMMLRSSRSLSFTVLLAS